MKNLQEKKNKGNQKSGKGLMKQTNIYLLLSLFSLSPHLHHPFCSFILFLPSLIFLSIRPCPLLPCQLFPRRLMDTSKSIILTGICILLKGCYRLELIRINSSPKNEMELAAPFV